MIKVLILLATTALLLSAAPLKNGDSVQRLTNIQFEDVNKKAALISEDIKMAIVAFEKDSNTMVSGYLNNQSSSFLQEHNAVYITDIHKMPSIISYLFAYPKMKKYKFPFYIYNEEGLEQSVSHQEEKITVLFFEKGVLKDVAFIATEDELKALFEKCAKGNNFEMK